MTVEVEVPMTMANGKGNDKGNSQKDDASTSKHVAKIVLGVGPSRH